MENLKKLGNFLRCAARYVGPLTFAMSATRRSALLTPNVHLDNVDNYFSSDRSDHSNHMETSLKHTAKTGNSGTCTFVFYHHFWAIALLSRVDKTRTDFWP